MRGKPSESWDWRDIISSREERGFGTKRGNLANTGSELVWENLCLEGRSGKSLSDSNSSLKCPWTDQTDGGRSKDSAIWSREGEREAKSKEQSCLRRIAGGGWSEECKDSLCLWAVLCTTSSLRPARTGGRGGKLDSKASRIGLRDRPVTCFSSKEGGRDGRSDSKMSRIGRFVCEEGGRGGKSASKVS